MKKKESIQKIDVYYRALGDCTKVGRLVLNENQIHFKYEENFLDLNLNISPFKLNFSSEIQTAESTPFDGLYGVFADSLPDGWGTLLLDRFLLSHDKPTETSILDRLAYVGNNGAGALEYLPSYDDSFLAEQYETNLDKYAQSALEILNGEKSEILDQFYHFGGTSGGARPKINILYSPGKNTLKSSTKLELSEGFENWLIKFPSTFDFPDIANVEFAYSKMAKAAGLKMSPCQLFKSDRPNNYFFGTKRFDRIAEKKIHKHSVAGLLHDDYRKSNIDYGHIFDASLRLQKNRNSFEQILRLMAFNVFSINQDDHSKNFSFLMDDEGVWEFSPVYDLTFSPNIYNFHSTSIGGVQQNVSKQNLKDLSKYFDIKNGNEIIDEVQDVVRNWKIYANDAGVSKLSEKKIMDRIQLVH